MMAQAVSGFRAREELLNGGEMTPALARVLEFAGPLPHTEIAKLNKAFRAAVQEVQKNTCAQLSGARDLAAVVPEGSEEELVARLEEPWRELEGIAARILQNLAAVRQHRMQNLMFNIVDEPIHVFQNLWGRLKQMKRDVVRGDDPLVRRVCLQSLVAHLQEMRERMDQLDQHYAVPLNVPMEGEGPWDPFLHLKALVRKCVLPSSLSRRFSEIVLPEQHSAKQDGARLAALHERQKVAASFTPAHEQRFLETTRHAPFFAARFVEAERVALDGEMARERDLWIFWQGIFVAFASLNIPIGEGAPEVADDIARWLEAEANAENLGRIRVLRLARLTHIPSQIQQLRNLRSLECRPIIGDHPAERLSTLPPEFGNLIHLEYLDLAGNAFQEIPEVIGGLTLRRLDLSWNQIREMPLFMAEFGNATVDLMGNPITELPDEIYRAFGSNLPMDPVNSNLRINQRVLERMPYSLWFKQIPVRIEAAWGNFLHALWTEIFDLLGLCGYPVVWVMAVVLLIPVLSFFACTIVFIRLLEPIVSTIRDALECDPMVDVEPLGVEAAPQEENNQ